MAEMTPTRDAWTDAGASQVERGIRPRAWLCELAQEDGTTRTQFVEQDPHGLRWNDAGETSPYRTTPLYEAPRWVPVGELMPDPGAAVLVTRGKDVMRAVHVPHMAFCEATHGYFEPDGATYYDEATDETYWPEGWYEWNEHEDTHWRVDREPTHWMPLPEPPVHPRLPD